jgi:hypothetical protein
MAQTAQENIIREEEGALFCVLIADLGVLLYYLSTLPSSMSEALIRVRVVLLALLLVL